MDEILLTPEEMVDAGLDGARKFADAICVYSYKTGLRQKRGKVPNRELYIREEVCRAQVKKVVEWLKKNNVAGQCYDSDLVDKWDLMLASEVWEELQLLVFHITEREETRQRMAALREAAGEGK